MKYHNKHNPKVVVTVVHEDVEYRIAETKTRCVAYTKEGSERLYVRNRAEFLSKFSPLAT